MVAGKGERERPERPDSGTHQEFLELCAVSTAGNLTEEEKKKLAEHLAICAECREAAKEFEDVADRAVLSLAPELAQELTGKPLEQDSSLDEDAAEASFLNRLSGKERREGYSDEENGWLSPLVVRRSRALRRLKGIHFWLPLGTAAFLCLGLGILTYRMGNHRGVEVTQRGLQGRGQDGAISQDTFEVAIRERDAANARLAEEDRTISALKREVAEESSQNAKLKTLQASEQAKLESSTSENEQVSAERDRFAQEAASGQAALQASEEKLRNLERERTESLLHSSSLEARVAELSRAVTEQQSEIDRSKELLAKDQDIRELMGARKLYVAEVLDIGQTGETQKAFGRVFYTKGKSLIFYAFDIDERPGWKNANSIQAWGMRGPDRQQALNLGLFYEDNATKKRWVLKFNDGKALSQIDAVFVTIEPHGGSTKPSREPFMFAYLKMDPNHP
jgi:hypothetical protein